MERKNMRAAVIATPKPFSGQGDDNELLERDEDFLHDTGRTQ